MNEHETPRRAFLKTGAAATAAVATFGFNRMAQAAHHEEADPIIQLVKFKIKEGAEESAKALLKELTAAVEADEPGVLAYVAHQSKKDPSEVWFYEVYKDQEAVAAHGGTDHMTKMRTQFMANFVPPLDIIAMDKVGGFMR